MIDLHEGIEAIFAEAQTLSVLTPRRARSYGLTIRKPSRTEGEPALTSVENKVRNTKYKAGLKKDVGRLLLDKDRRSREKREAYARKSAGKPKRKYTRKQVQQ